jgi:hypothetical protein
MDMSKDDHTFLAVVIFAPSHPPASKYRQASTCTSRKEILGSIEGITGFVDIA